MIANQYATTLNVALNASTYKIIKGNTTEDTEYFKAGLLPTKSARLTKQSCAPPLRPRRCPAEERQRCPAAGRQRQSQPVRPWLCGPDVRRHRLRFRGYQQGPQPEGSTGSSGHSGQPDAVGSVQVRQHDEELQPHYPGLHLGYAGANTQYAVNEAPWSALSSAESSFAEYGDAAIVVFSRSGGEGADLPSGTNGTNDSWISGSEAAATIWSCLQKRSSC